MAVEVRKIAEQGRTLWNKLPPRRRWTIAGALAATVGVIGFLALRAPTESWATLFAGLAEDDAARVIEALHAQNVPYRVASGGAVEVPEAKVHELRITLAGAGIPRGGGVGFEVFDKQALGTTSFVEQMNYRRALQGELARTIMALDAVERARVHIAIPEKTLFRNQEDTPSASVAVALRHGRSLGGAQVRGIVHLVASSVEGLRPDRVTLVDETGTVLWSGDGGAGGGDGGSQEIERTLARRVIEMVEHVVGRGHAAATVTAEVDWSRSERTEETYDKDRIALRSEQRTVDKTAGGDTATSGVAGARGNLPGAPAPSQDDSDDGTTHLSETRNYEVNRVTQKTLSPEGRLKRLHVAVLVDGQTGKDGKDGQFVPRNAEEMARIASLAREAAGIDAERGDKIEVHCAPFARAVDETLGAAAAPPTLWELARSHWPLAAGAAGGALALLAMGAVLLRRRGGAPRAQLLPVPMKVGEIEQAMAPSNQLGDGQRDPRTRVLEAARGDAERAARVLAAWISEPDPSANGGAA